MKKIVLASTSKTREKLLSETGLFFECVPSNYEEDMTLDLPPSQLAKYLSSGKAEAVAEIYKDSIIIGADTFVVFEDKIIGKPHTNEKARETLQMLSGKEHLIITGFTIIDSKNNKIISKSVETKVFFKNLTDNEIEEYIKTGEPLDKAGSYAILELGANLIDKIEGSKSNVSGLPIEELLESLKEFNMVT